MLRAGQLRCGRIWRRRLSRRGFLGGEFCHVRLLAVGRGDIAPPPAQPRSGALASGAIEAFRPPRPRRTVSTTLLSCEPKSSPQTRHRANILCAEAIAEFNGKLYATYKGQNRDVSLYNANYDGTSWSGRSNDIPGNTGQDDDGALVAAASGGNINYAFADSNGASLTGASVTILVSVACVSAPKRDPYEIRSSTAKRQRPLVSGSRPWRLPHPLLCQLRGARTATLTLFDDGAGADGAWPPVPIDIDALAGAKSALDEACPPGLSTRR